MLSESKQAVFLLPNSVCNSAAHILKLSHPKEPGVPCLVYLDTKTKSLTELLSRRDKHVSWFVGDTVCGGSKLSVGTPLDPLFMILPYLVGNLKSFSPLSQILEDAKFPCVAHLDGLVSDQQLECVADRKEMEGQIVKFNKTKTLDWLTGKVDAVIKAMKEANVSPGFNSALSAADYTRYACGIVCDYISSSLACDLHEKLGVPMIDSIDEEKMSKKRKLSADSEKPVQQVNKTAKGKERAKPKVNKVTPADTKGMKSMSAFFRKK